ncbi:MAG: hypothetical protein ACYSW0_25380, partial [Planctomycetota bacterium]
MKEIKVTVVSVHAGSNEDLSKEAHDSITAGSNEDLSKEAHDSITAELDGFVGDRHKSYKRETWAGDKQKEGTIRRNERQWSAVSVEELGDIQKAMDLKEP